MSRTRKTLIGALIVMVMSVALLRAATGCRPAEGGPVSDMPGETGSPNSPSETLDLAAVSAALDGLPLDRFFQEAWDALALRDPETLVAYGLARPYGLLGDELTNISDSYIRDTYALAGIILEELREYDRDVLDPDQQVSYDVLEWYLDDLVRQEDFLYHDYPVTFMTVNSVPLLTEHFFTDLHPLVTERDAEDYVARLGRIAAKFSQLEEGLDLREAAGVVAPRFALQWAIGPIRNLAGSRARDTPYYQALADKTAEMSGLSFTKRTALLRDAAGEIEGTVIPAYQSLAQAVDHLISVAPSDDGVWQYPDGDDYYAYLVRHATTTEMTPEEIHQLGLAELDRIHGEMRAIFDQLGYPRDESLPELYNRVAADAGYVSGSRVKQTYEAFIDQAEAKLGEAFSKTPGAPVEVVQGPLSGAYEPPSVDGSRPGRFYAGPASGRSELYGMRTLTYHETVPGHHLQLTYPIDGQLPAFRSFITFTSFAEGWALYAERLVSELGWYEGDPYGELGRLQFEAFRAARLVIDTGIHAKGWTMDEGVRFFTVETGLETGDIVDPLSEVARYVVWPGQALAYDVGMLKMLELRQKAIDTLGDRFDLKEYHDVVLRNGSLPLEVLERVVDDYIAEKLDS